MSPGGQVSHFQLNRNENIPPTPEEQGKGLHAHITRASLLSTHLLVSIVLLRPQDGNLLGTLQSPSLSPSRPSVLFRGSLPPFWEKTLQDASLQNLGY